MSVFEKFPAAKRSAAVVLLAGVALAGCAQKPVNQVTASKLRVYAADVTGGAKTCDVPKVSAEAGKTTEAAIKLANDGGWCGIVVHQDGPKPYDAGLLTARAEHGSVTIHSVGDDTRIDYTPDHGFAGNDSYTVKLLPGDTTIKVSASVSMPVAKAQ